MKVKSIENPDSTVTWDVRPSSWPLKAKAACRSNIQYEIGQIIKKRYPLDPLIEDVTIPESRLSLDFFLPNRKIAFEVQGEQHDQMNPFFHKTHADFEDQKHRDEIKRFFCELNNIKLYEVRSVSETQRILNV